MSRLWDLDLIERQGPGTLVHVSRSGRLVRVGTAGLGRLELHWMDEASLGLVESAISRRSSLTLLYPALAPEVATLIAAEYLVHALVHGFPEPSVGLVTADPARAAAVWEELRIESQGAREPLWDVFPYWRASPDGSAPFNGLLRGVVIGRRCADWGVDLTVVDDLAGPVEVDASGPVIRVTADPLDFQLGRLAGSGTPLWGWSEAILAMHTAALRPIGSTPRIPFSVAADRVATLARGLALTVTICGHANASARLNEARGGLMQLAQLAGESPGRHLLTGLRVAWSHLSTLASLPCRPSVYDRFAGIPPRAARATSEFEREVAGWARTLEPKLREPAEDVASALGQLRQALEDGNPIHAAIERATLDGTPGHLIVRTRTAARAVTASFGGKPEDLQIGALRVTWNANLHSALVAKRAVVVGAPPRSGWHRLASGIAPRIELLVLGSEEAKRAERAWDSLRVARSYWSSQKFRAKAWTALLGEPPPPPYPEVDVHSAPAVLGSGPEFTPAFDPFTPLGALMRDDRPLLAEEGPPERLIELVPGQAVYRATVTAVEVCTDRGYVLIPDDREVDIILGEQLESEVAIRLTKGMRLILGREGGRLDLLAALADRLGHRPDLLSAKLLIDDFQQRVHRAFAESGWDVTYLCDRMRSRGCKKTPTAIRSWVSRRGPMGPRDFEDVRWLSAVLHIDYAEARLREIHAGLDRVRVFRRVAGAAVARAATAALFSRADSQVDAELGLSVADLREAVIVATVIGLRTFPRPVNVTEIGHLQELPYQ